VSRDLRIDQALERGDRGGGMIDMLRKESVISESVVRLSSRTGSCYLWAGRVERGP
jgi:hypothetical protein